MPELFLLVFIGLCISTIYLFIKMGRLRDTINIKLMTQDRRIDHLQVKIGSQDFELIQLKACTQDLPKQLKPLKDHDINLLSIATEEQSTLAALHSNKIAELARKVEMLTTKIADINNKLDVSQTSAVETFAEVETNTKKISQLENLIRLQDVDPRKGKRNGYTKRYFGKNT